MRTLREQLPWLRSFRNVEKLRDARCRSQYNEHWFVERNEFRLPRQAGHAFLALRAAG